MPGEFLLTGAIDQLMLGSPTAEQLAALTGLQIVLKSNILPSQGIPMSGGLFYVPQRAVTVLSSGQISEDGTNNGIMLLANDTTLGLTSAVQWTLHPGRVTLGGKPIKLATWTFQAPAPGASRTLNQLAPVPNISAVPVATIGIDQVTGPSDYAKNFLANASDAAHARTLIGADRFQFLGNIASQAAMLALTGERGDYCNRTDLGDTFVLTDPTAPTLLVSWTSFAYPVTTVAGKSGAVTLVKGDVGLALADNVADVNKPVSTAQAAAIAAKLNTSAVVDNADGSISVGSVVGMEPLTPAAAIQTTSAAPSAGQITLYNATSGNLTPALPALSGLTAGRSRLAVGRDPADASTNTVTFSLPGGDTFYSSGSTSFTMPLAGERRELQVISVSGTKYWVPSGSLNPLTGLDGRYAFATPAGKIVSATIGSSGWYADIVIAGLSTGGTYNFGLGPFNKLALPKVAFTVTSLGFDDSGTANTVVRTVYGTKQVRQAYPNQALMQETAAGGNVTVRVALSDYVYAKDKSGGGNSGTDVTVDVLAGFYTQGGIPSAAASLVATNSSTLAYPKVVGNWAWPSLDKITGTTFTVKAVGFHSSGRQARPVRCVKFTATDTHSHTATTTVTSPTYDNTVGDAVPVTEYIATMDASTLTALDVVTCNFVAYPWIGDTAACLDTSAGTAQPTPLYGPVVRLNDKSATYGASYAVVDSASGNDGTGVAAGTFSAGSPPAAFATIKGAYDAVRAYNNTNYARNNAGGSTIYLRGNASHAFMGGTPTVGTTPATWLTVTTFPGDAQASIATTSGGKSAGLMLKLLNVNFSAQVNTGTISAGAGAYLWFDQCVINCPTTNAPPVYINTICHVTRCTITALDMGFISFAAVNTAFAILRGNTVNGIGQYTYPYTYLGNKRVTALGFGAGSLTDVQASQTTPAATNTVIAFNQLTQPTLNTSPAFSSPLISIANGTKSYTHGIAIVQNVLEQMNATGTGDRAFVVAGDGALANTVNNVLMWNNVVVGERTNIAYDDADTGSGGGLSPRSGWSVKNNVFDDANIKSDTFFVAAGYSADGAKVGNWSELYGVGFSGNVFSEAANTSAAVGSFLWEFPGLSCDQPGVHGTTNGAPGDSTSIRPTEYVQFVARASNNGSNGAGNGNYHVAAGSPAQGLSRDLLLPYDFAGVARTAASPAGAYS